MIFAIGFILPAFFRHCLAAITPLAIAIAIDYAAADIAITLFRWYAIIIIFHCCHYADIITIYFHYWFDAMTFITPLFSPLLPLIFITPPFSVSPFHYFQTFSSLRFIFADIAAFRFIDATYYYAIIFSLFHYFRLFSIAFADYFQPLFYLLMPADYCHFSFHCFRYADADYCFLLFLMPYWYYAIIAMPFHYADDHYGADYADIIAIMPPFRHYW